MSTLDDALRARLRTAPGDPLVTFYDDATGERTELSATTWANWVAKTAGALVEEFDLDEGDGVRLELRPHWLGTVLLGATALVGLDRLEDGDADLLVTGPEGQQGTGSYADLLVCSLHPFALPLAPGDLPAGAVDFGTVWPNQPDAFLGVPSARPLPSVEPSSDRVITDLDPLSEEGTTLFWSTLLGGGSVVWVARPLPERWEGRATAERAVRVVRARS
ncbi:hypothetical protein GCM10027425_32260 [Alteromonas gracilis]